MQARLVRVAAVAVLYALSFGMRAAAFPASAVRLEPARLFDPQSESLLATLNTEIAGMSYVDRDVFNIGSMPELAIRDDGELLASAIPAPASSVNLPGVGEVQYQQPRLQPSAVPFQRLASASGAELSMPVTPPDVSVPALHLATAAPVHFGSYASYTPAMQSLAAAVSVPLRVGAVHFNGVMGGLQSQSQQADAFRALQVCGTTDENAACPYLHDTSEQRFVAGTDFDLRAGGSNVDVQLSSSVAHLSSGDSVLFPYIPVDPDAQLSGTFDTAGPDASVVQYPGLAGVVKHGLDARLAVPVTSRITLGLQYDRSHYQGDYGSGLLPGLDAYKNTYLGNVSYQLPNTSSLLTLSARQYRYQDSFSNFNLTQTRADLNFTVKF